MSLTGCFDGTEAFVINFPNVANCTENQTFQIPAGQTPISELKVLFTESFDLYSRVIVYSLLLRGIPF